MIVNVVKPPAIAITEDVEAGSSVADVLLKAGLTSEGLLIQLDGENAELEDTVSRNSTISLLQKLKGNR